MDAISLSHARRVAVPPGQDASFLALRSELKVIGDAGIDQHDSDIPSGFYNRHRPSPGRPEGEGDEAEDPMLLAEV